MSDGDRETFGVFYRATYQGTVAYLYALAGDLGEAQEAAQEAYLRAWSRWRRVSAYEDPAGWVRRVGSNVAVSRWRRARTAVRSWTRHGPPPPQPEPGPESVLLVDALRRLPVAQRRALVLHHMAGRSVAQIAEEEGVAEGTVKARLSRGRSALAVVLTDPSTEVADRV